jgi:PilZ domain-containing protein
MAVERDNQAQIATPPKFVIPVRYVAGGTAVHTTSSDLSADAIHVRTAWPLKPGRVVPLQLYFPNLREPIAPLSIVAERTAGGNPGFWAEFAGNDGTKDRIAALLARQRESADRMFRRFHTELAASVRQRGQPQVDGQLTNISQTGAFLRLETLPAKGAVVELDVRFSSEPHTVLGFVVHAAPRRGVGIQFIGASDEFQSQLDGYLAGLARRGGGA